MTRKCCNQDIGVSPRCAVLINVTSGMPARNVATKAIAMLSLSRLVLRTRASSARKNPNTPAKTRCSEKKDSASVPNTPKSGRSGNRAPTVSMRMDPVQTMTKIVRIRSRPNLDLSGPVFEWFLGISQREYTSGKYLYPHGGSPHPFVHGYF